MNPNIFVTHQLKLNSETFLRTYLHSVRKIVLQLFHRMHHLLSMKMPFYVVKQIFFLETKNVYTKWWKNKYVDNLEHFFHSTSTKTVLPKLVSTLVWGMVIQDTCILVVFPDASSGGIYSGAWKFNKFNGFRMRWANLIIWDIPLKKKDLDLMDECVKSIK